MTIRNRARGKRRVRPQFAFPKPIWLNFGNGDRMPTAGMRLRPSPLPAIGDVLLVRYAVFGATNFHGTPACSNAGFFRQRLYRLVGPFCDEAITHGQQGWAQEYADETKVQCSAEHTKENQ